MQTVPFTQLVQEYPASLQQETDTATPRQQIPIYLIHDADKPFCANTSCFCQRGKRAGAMMYQELAAGKLYVAQVKTGGQPTTTSQPTVYLASLIEGIPEECQLYGHTWELTESPDVKECSICHVRGYCPGCTPLPPSGAQPFSCSAHTGRRGRQ